MNRHPSVLPTGIFSPRRALHPLGAGAMPIHGILVARNSIAFPAAFAPSGGPPGITTLRI
jgi:hypothetical protein